MGARSTAALRLKEQVDDVIAATRALPPGAGYEDLRTAISSHYEFSPVDSVVMFRLTGNPAYIDQAIRMVDLFVLSENALISSGATPKVAADSYLGVGRCLAELSLVYDYGYERLSAIQRERWSALAEQTLFNLWHPDKAAWGSVAHPWSGWSLEDPGNNYYYSFLLATELWALASRNPAWTAFLQERKFTQMVPYFSLLPGGGSREGTGYGTAVGALFEAYAYWKDSTGEDLAAYSSHASETIDYWIHATVPTFDFYAPIGDQSRSSMPNLFDYHRHLMLEAVGLSAGTQQALRGSWWLDRAKLTDGGGGWVTGQMRYDFNFRYDLLGAPGRSQAPVALSYEAAGVGVLFARSDWSTSASWMHVVAGRYDQSHAHQDQGSFSFFRKGWLTVTSNVLSHSGLSQGTEAQNVVRFERDSKPIPQNYSTSARKVGEAGDRLQIDADLSPAYSDHATQVKSWTRRFEYVRSAHSLTIEDRCSVATDVTPVWQLHVPVEPVRQPDGSYRAGALRIIPRVPLSPPGAVVSMKTVSEDYDGGFRLELRAPAQGCEFIVSLLAQ
jgi:hypothetical protein